MKEAWRGGTWGALGWARARRLSRQGRLQSHDLGKHLAGVEDLLQLHELVEADIAVQAERVRAVSASALRFCDPGKGEPWGKELSRERLRKENSQTGKTGDRKDEGWVGGDGAREGGLRGGVCRDS